MAKFLVCDEPNETEGVKQYRVFGLGSGGFADPAIVQADPAPEYGFKLDLSNIKPGSYSVKARALNEWGESQDSSPFEFTVPEVPSQPVGLSIV